MNTTSSITFYCRKSRVNATGAAAIEVCVTIGGEKMTTTLPRRCKPSEFRKQIQSRSQNPIKEYAKRKSSIIHKTEVQAFLLRFRRGYVSITEMIWKSKTMIFSAFFAIFGAISI